MVKVLKPYTIIPHELYVQRDADRQLKSIIADMGRPGYVLVSRQMGKTNLLLNAKRELESAEDVFVYVDLSNHFENARQCFENIINTAVESNSSLLTKIYDKIKQDRLEIIETPAHIQHLNELRQLLSIVKGKLVIILDEIDALTKTDYSDQIFAQIRSIYFSRVNYKELERLTYILSGVIEPSEIIKNPKISPFNIGQKIFLNDFSSAEFKTFIDNSKLNIPRSLQDRIFYWTNGNPRMTWDICAEVEDMVLSNKNLTIEKIDNVVKNLYLKTFDRPPLDHIRDIVKQEKDVRDAIVKIENNKSNEISQKVKNKLYLSGIINYDDTDIHIKNEIIRNGLDIKWIATIEEEERGVALIALDLIDKGNYKEGLEKLENYLLHNEFNDNDKRLYYNQMGLAAFYLRSYSKALNYFNQVFYDKVGEAILHSTLFYFKGLCNYYLGNISESLADFKVVMEGNVRDGVYAQGLFNYGVVSIKSENVKDKEEAINIFNDIISGSRFDESKVPKELINELKSISYYNLAQILVNKRDFKLAQEYYRNALSLAKPSKKPAIALKLSEILDNSEERQALLKDIVEKIKDNSIVPSPSNEEDPLKFNIERFKDLSVATFLNYRDTLFESLKDKLIYLGDESFGNQIYALALYCITEKGDWKLAKRIFDVLYSYLDSKEAEFDKATEFNIVKFEAYLNNATESNEAHIRYANLFLTDNSEEIDSSDFDIFANLIFSFYKKEQYGQALKYVKIIESVKNSINQSLLVNYLVIYNLEMHIYLNTSDNKSALRKASEILNLVNNDSIKNQKSNLLGETGIEVIKGNAMDLLNPKKQNVQPIKVSKPYNRNDFVKVRYKDGVIRHIKYKKVENDIIAGECVIIE
jgi:tetratricopeptide (TPR) repeat protein